MKEIQLNNGKAAIVDDDDFEWLNQFKWQVYSDGYVRARGNLLMHRLIMKSPCGAGTDHINHNKLDNRRCNLRICNQSLNMANSIDHGYKGVRWDKHAGKWRVTIGYNYKRFHLGLFTDRDKAKEVYDKMAKELFGEFANDI
jgi:hypothetical protein